MPLDNTKKICAEGYGYTTWGTCETVGRSEGAGPFRIGDFVPAPGTCQFPTKYEYHCEYSPTKSAE
jgi:hypothetical protein